MMITWEQRLVKINFDDLEAFLEPIRIFIFSHAKFSYLTSKHADIKSIKIILKKYILTNLFTILYILLTRLIAGEKHTHSSIFCMLLCQFLGYVIRKEMIGLQKIKNFISIMLNNEKWLKIANNSGVMIIF